MNTGDYAEMADKLQNYLEGMYGLTAKALRVLIAKLIEEGLTEEQAFQIALKMSKS